ncbi:hypothetical protein NCCP2716_27000 [Sporosarcina sp. NCCP-2716]|uniref:hypothetical protein n=1 Tax=Sporosarcina sp. NCCP-2716 TaxID=2943679 RepID=UPI00203B08D5|nr:hypothetical protein [Sporosarcina sp. NCCP-2716]GKV70202.1 hypothetical protein NCCP2716_27000 [Sporosarcina sp. NCCP-2716]
MKRIANILILLFIPSLLIACNNPEDEEYFIYSSNFTDQLIECLDNEGIKYKLDDNENVLIKRKDNGKAVMRCA